MALAREDLIEAVGLAHKHFMKHARGATDAQWDWKPYRECKSIRETVAHLTDGVCRASGAAAPAACATADEALAALEGAYRALYAYLCDQPAETFTRGCVTLWGSPMPLRRGLDYLTSEYSYHAGQIGFIRLATDPEWDYDAAVYGDEGG